MPGSVATSAWGRPHTPDGRGCIAPPNVAAPWRGPTRYALRSRARLMARRTLGIDEHVVVHVGVVLKDDQLRLALLRRLGVRAIPAAAGDVELSGLQRGNLRGAILDVHPLDTVQVRPALHEVVRVAHVLD